MQMIVIVKGVDFTPKSPRQHTRTAKHYKGNTANRRVTYSARYAAKHFASELAQCFMPKGFAYKALNPDTQILCEYPLLAKCSDGHHWQSQFCHKMGRLLQVTEHCLG